jgi:O-antigen/teichoic acid export membrane protein
LGGTSTSLGQTAPARPLRQWSRLATNAASVLASDVTNRAATFAVYLLVARFLGSHELGQLSLALTFFYLGQVLAIASLRTLLTRELSRTPERAPEYATAAALVAGGASLGSLLLLTAAVLVLGYSAGTTAVILLVAGGVPGYAIGAVAEGMLLARERMTLVAAATVPMNAVKLGGAAVLLATGGGDMRLLALLLTACQWGTAAVEWLLVVRCVAVPQLRPDLAVARRLARSSAPFLGIDCLSAVTASANIVVLSKLLDERAVGLYSMAAQLLVPLELLARNVLLAAFPMMCARREASDGQGLERATRALFWLMLAFGVTAAAGCFLLAPQILHLLYGDRAGPSAVSILRLLAWTALLTPLTALLGQVLYACLRERSNLAVTVVDAVLSVTLSLLLVSWLGSRGAAWAVLCVALVDFVLHRALVRRVLPDLRLLRPSPPATDARP